MTEAEDSTESQTGVLAAWIDRDVDFFPVRFEHQILILRPDAAEPHRSGTHFHVTSADDAPLEEREESALEAVILAQGASGMKHFAALYGGYSKQRDVLDLPGLTPFALPRAANENLQYFLLEGALETLMPSTLEPRFSVFAPLSALHPADMSWFLSAPPDLPVVVIGCGAVLASALLADPILGAREWTGQLRWTCFDDEELD